MAPIYLGLRPFNAKGKKWNTNIYFEMVGFDDGDLPSHKLNSKFCPWKWVGKTHTHTILWPKRPRKKAEKLVEFMQLCLLERKQQMIAPSKSCYLNQQERDQGLKGLANLAIWGGIVVSSEPRSLNSWCWGRSSHWKMTGIRIMGTKAAAIGLMTVPLTWRTNGSLDPGTHESGGAAGFHEALFGQLTIHHDSCC